MAFKLIKVVYTFILHTNFGAISKLKQPVGSDIEDIGLLPRNRFSSIQSLLCLLYFKLC